MKTLPYILLLSLFSHTLLWGQDTLKFEPLEITDTIWVEKIQLKDSTSLLWINKKLDIIISKNEGSQNISEVAIFKKQDKYWLKAIIDFCCLYEITTPDSESQFILFHSGSSFGSNGITGSWVELTIVDVYNLNVTEAPLFIEHQTEGWDWTDVNSEVQITYCCVEIKFSRMIMYIEDGICDVNNEGISSIEKDDLCVPTGEYHYINGNFVRVKPNNK